jgi:hypothetical protein
MSRKKKYSKCSILSRKKSNNICYSDKSIKKFIKKEMNEIPNKDSKINIEKIKKYMKKKYGCEDQVCWSDHSDIFSDAVYLPKARWNKKDRLVSNYDLSNLMKQYEFFYNKRTKTFKYLSDWDHDLPMIMEDKDKFIDILINTNEYKYRAIVFSLWGKKDKYLKHWTCIFINRGIIYFFDSNGDPDTRWKIADVIEIISNETGIKKYVYNECTVQYDYEHCGIFCAHFIHSMLVDEISFKKFLMDLLEKKKTLGREKYYKYIMSLRDKYYITEH